MENLAGGALIGSDISGWISFPFLVKLLLEGSEC
jgi:hypothetical protein